MTLPFRVFATLLLGVCYAGLAGCANSAAPTGGGELHDDHDKHDDHDDHAHHDHEALGPNGGHLLELGEEQYHAEWVHDDEAELVTVVLLDSTGKKEVPTDAESIAISVTIAEKTTNEYLLPAVDPAEGKASRFALKNGALITALNVGEGVVATLKVTINGELFSQVIEHHDHSHDH